MKLIFESYWVKHADDSSWCAWALANSLKTGYFFKGRKREFVLSVWLFLRWDTGLLLLDLDWKQPPLSSSSSVFDLQIWGLLLLQHLVSQFLTINLITKIYKHIIYYTYLCHSHLMSFVDYVDDPEQVKPQFPHLKAAVLFKNIVPKFRLMQSSLSIMSCMTNSLRIRRENMGKRH